MGCGMCIEITGDGTPLESSTVGTPFKGTLKAVIVDICGSCKQGNIFTLHFSIEPHSDEDYHRVAKTLILSTCA